ncbi:MAG: hypothetical protein MK434_11580, partial [SAR324 cluster bacterium]|nr:hypothetical protein [SAR324 cluster bacterium]
RNENDEKLTFEPKRVSLSQNPGSTLSKNNKFPLLQGGFNKSEQLYFSNKIISAIGTQRQKLQV